MIYQAPQRGMHLHIAATELTQKISARITSYEKVGEILYDQFTEFSDSTRQITRIDSYKYNR
jgi:hypothetical protein